MSDVTIYLDEGATTADADAASAAVRELGLEWPVDGSTGQKDITGIAATVLVVGPLTAYFSKWAEMAAEDHRNRVVELMHRLRRSRSAATPEIRAVDRDLWVIVPPTVTDDELKLLSTLDWAALSGADAIITWDSRHRRWRAVDADD